MDPTLDIYSPSFDAAKALYSSDFKPPKEVQPLDYVAKCRVLLPTWDTEYLKPLKPKEKSKDTPGNVSNTEKSQEISASEALEKAAEARRKEQTAPRPHLFDQIADRYEIGPMSMMRQLYKDKARVAVYIRRVKDLRGVCIGTLIAFDKHFNLLLKDVVDEYVVNVQKREVSDAPDGTERMVTVQEKRTRLLPQLFIKGDSVALVARAQVRLDTKDASSTST